MTEEGWEEFGFRFGPFEIGMSGLGQFIKHTRTEIAHILRIRIDPAVRRRRSRLAWSGQASLRSSGLAARAKTSLSSEPFGTP
jgi:hypothetical protein